MQTGICSKPNSDLHKQQETNCCRWFSCIERWEGAGDRRSARESLVSGTTKMHRHDLRTDVASGNGNHGWTPEQMEQASISATSNRAAEIPGEQSLGKAFVAALLLTGNLEEAETAVLDGIRSLDPDGELDEALVRGTVNAAIERRPEV